MLSPFDDYPVHQTLEPLRRPGTTDRNYYDRYYFNVHTPSSSGPFLAMGFGVYPNRGVVDGYIAVLADGTHYVTRASRTLDADRARMEVGPLRIEVIEGLRRLRVVCEPSSGDIAADLVWNSTIPAHLEPRHTLERGSRTIMDMCRFTQTGTWEGTLVVDGHTYEVDPQTYLGMRDHSWGVRPLGEPESGGIDSSVPPLGGYWSSAAIRLADRTILFSAQEDIRGVRSYGGTVAVYTDPSVPDEDLGQGEHAWTFVPGTRQLSGGTLTFPDSAGKVSRIVVEPLLPFVLSLGTGYGGEAVPQPGLVSWRHGMYLGELSVETPKWVMAEIPPEALFNSTIENVCRFTTNTGEVGYGTVNLVIAGANERYGFTGFTDGAV
ncbi:hypothetical protein K7711_41020 [Nocardia sp. CA2R105]|uniref:hypothetical protein n=1 Tax=Nocardia coffeae TaxID=2873381 RepID=UPI001CA61B4D|nr:hypothetical protein [Nocardia coffeae]MBY8862911.1 hypothetical protein [Nocardia coffeae]